MKALLFFALISTSSFALDCQSVGTHSCTMADGMCFEYLENEQMPMEQLETLCNGMQGNFQKATCSKEFNVGTCINEMNPLMSIIRFNQEFDSETSEMLCSSMGGQFCK